MTDTAFPFQLRACAFVSLALACAPLAAWSASLPGVPNVPNAGTLLQQVQPQGEATPNTNPGLTIGTPGGAASTDTTPIPVTRFELGGNTAFDTATLHALVADAEGKTLTLAQLDALAKRIADYYHDHGYLLAQALVPPQTLKDGVVRIVIVEAHYGAVKLENHSRVRDSLLLSTLAPLQSDSPVTQQPLDRSLLLLGDVPGAVPHAQLAPGQNPGTSDLTVEVDPQPLFSGQAGVDNEGDGYTGRTRGNVALALNNPLHQGDVLDVDAMTSGRGMTWGQVDYHLTLNGLGTQAGASYSTLGYHLGESLAALRAHGTAEVASAWLAQPLVRGQTLNVSGRLQFDNRQLDDDIDTSSLHNERHLNSVTAAMTADWVDSLLGGASTRVMLGLTHGVLAFNDGIAQAADAATADTQGGYTLLNASVNRLQRLTDATRLYLAFSYQQASRNVDTSEQWLLGGPGTVRGYAVSTLGGSSGWLATAELRHDLVLPAIGAVQVKAFVDSGDVTVNADPWAVGENRAHLTGMGVGLDWNGPHQLAASVQVAVPVGSTPELVGTRAPVQVWAQLSKAF